MGAGIPILATVTSAETGEFEAAISHLTLSTAFVETMHSATFGDPLELRVSGLVVKAEVVFVADAPMGWVVRFDPNRALLERASSPPARSSIDINDIEIEDPVTFNPGPVTWGEPTPTFDGAPKVSLPK